MIAPISTALVVMSLWSAELPATSAVEPLARAYRKTPSAATRLALTNFAAQHPRDLQGAVALLALAGADTDGQLHQQALTVLRSIAPARLAKVQDHVAFLTATALYGTAQNDIAVLEALTPVFAHNPKSPLVPRAAVLGARAANRAGDPQRALQLLRTHYADLTQPQGDIVLAETFEKANDLVSAANYYQRVWQQYPMAKEAADAETALARLKSQMGDAYPPPMPAATLRRAARLMEISGQQSRAKKDLEAALPSFTGADREIALVRIAAADNSASTLRNLSLTDPEASAERLAHLTHIARRAGSESEMLDAVRQLRQHHPQSRFRLEALLSAGSYYFLKVQPSDYYSIYQECSMGFPREPQAALCHWRAALSEYIRNRPAAETMLRDHIRYFPTDENVPACLYFLGRLAEQKQDRGAARVYLAEVESAYPNYYYAILARKHLSPLSQAAPSQEAQAFLAGVKFPSRKRIEDFNPTAATNLRIERARILTAAALDFHSDLELRFAGRTDAQSHLAAMELAANATRRGSPDQAMRWIKAVAPYYLMMPIESAPREFWRYAYPWPWRKELEEHSKANDVDPFLMAGLIRQESEFDPRVVSYANAHGLSQIMPPTGRELARRLGIRPFSQALLFNPVINIRMGTFHMRNMYNYFGQKMEETIASYNAGMGRVSGWLKLSSTQQFREPAEWVETIPIDQTRGYVQSVMRNADFYRRLYGNAPTEYTPVSYVAPPPAPATKKTTTTKRRTTAKKAAVRKRTAK
jgi:soluble lytic murein transglycosylase